MGGPGLAGGEEVLDRVEVALAHDRFEALIWAHHLDEQGIPMMIETRSGWAKALSCLGQRLVALKAPRRDAGPALASLPRYRFV